MLMTMYDTHHIHLASSPGSFFLSAVVIYYVVSSLKFYTKKENYTKRKNMRRKYTLLCELLEMMFDNL